MALLAPLVAACSSGGGGSGGLGATVKRAAFTSKDFGVAVSPRVSTNPNPPKGGGRYLVGKPYQVRGKTYTPQAEPAGYVAKGSASWYGSDFHGRRTANGEIFSANAITAAHPTLPLPSYVRVTNLDNGRSLMVRVNDRGPYMHGRIIDLSHRAAEILGYVGRGTGNVQVNYVGPAPLEGDDTRVLLASVSQQPIRQDDTRFALTETNVQVASAEWDAPVPAQHRPGSAADAVAVFGYAADDPISAAHAAANAMASGDAGLQDWVNATDEDALRIKLQLGVFRNEKKAIEIAEAFAFLGAVDEVRAKIEGEPATVLTLTHLKPGVGREDVLRLARELGLNDIVLY